MHISIANDTCIDILCDIFIHVTYLFYVIAIHAKIFINLEYRWKRISLFMYKSYLSFVNYNIGFHLKILKLSKVKPYLLFFPGK